MSSNPIRVRAADLQADRETILAVLSRSLPNAADADRYRWLYLDNPCGPARVWLAEDASTGDAIGTSAGYPKRVYVEGAVETVLNLSDFAFDQAHRTLGPALKLLRATLDAMKDPDLSFSYDRPSEAMLAIYKRMGTGAVSPLRRWVRLIEMKPTLTRRFGAGLAVNLIGRVGDVMLHARDRVFGTATPGGNVTPLLGDPGPEFDALDAELARTFPLRLQRSASYLRWRYLQSVTAPHEILCARDHGSLLGYLVFRPREGGVMALVDLLTLGDPRVASALVRTLFATARARGASAVWATVMRNSPIEAVLGRTGFLPRGEDPGVVVYAPRATAERRTLLGDPQHWWMLSGDQDV
jgi:hypothetical protein